MKARAWFFFGMLVLPTLPFACVLSEPSPLIKPGTRRPTILHGREFPPASRVLLENPGTFYVPVEVVDPNTTYSYQVLLDWPLQPVEKALLDLGKTISGSPSNPNIQTINFGLLSQLTDGRCHQITFRVGLSFDPDNALSAETDTITWFFEPPGQVGRCSSVASLVDGSFDSGPDGGDP